MKKYICIYALSSALFLTSCVDKESIFNPTILQEQSKEAFPVKDIDPNQDWNLITRCKVSVSINQRSSETYKVKVFTSDPFNPGSDAKLIAQRENIKDNSSTTLNFNVAKTIKYLYVVLEDSKYNRSMQSAELVDSSVSLSWGNEVEKGSIASRSFTDYGSRSTSRSITSESITFPTDIPSGAINYVGIDYNVFNNKDIFNYYIDGTASSVTIRSDKFHSNSTGKNKNLYIKGTVIFNNNQITTDYTLYILPGAKVTFINDLETLENSSIYVSSGATITTNKTLKVKGNFYNQSTLIINITESSKSFYNIGKIECADLTLNSGKLSNEGEFISTGLTANYLANIENSSSGKMTINGNVLLSNNNELINEGTFTSNSLKADNSSKIDNFPSATMTISGLTNLTNSNILTNDGTFITNSLTTTSNTTQINNNCTFKVTSSSAHIDGATLNLNGASYTYFQGISKFGQSKINMGSGALMFVENNLHFEKGGNNFVYGPATGNRALLYIGGDLKSDNKGTAIITLSKNVDYACENGFTATELKTENGASRIELDNITLKAESGCSRAFSTDSGGDPPSTPSTTIYTFAFEDMFKEVGDYDFNDVVVKVYSVASGDKVNVQLVAAGASKKLYVFYKYDGGSETPLFGGKEVHDALGAPEGSMANTSSTTRYKFAEDVISLPINYLMDKLDIYIKSSGSSAEIHIPLHTNSFYSGDVPYAILVPIDWDYPSERQSVINKYPSFVNWAQNANVNLDWYN